MKKTLLSTAMEYKELDLYCNNSDNTARFVLGKRSDKPLYAIALNPSTADDVTPDATVRKLMKFAEENGFNSFVLFNLYPLRATKPHALPKDMECDEMLLTQNIEKIAKLIPNDAIILACWGSNINIRKYLRRSLSLIAKELENKNCNWVAAGLTVCEDPVHLARAAYGEFIKFDFDNYVQHLNL